MLHRRAVPTALIASVFAMALARRANAQSLPLAALTITADRHIRVQVVALAQRELPPPLWTLAPQNSPHQSIEVEASPTRESMCTTPCSLTLTIGRYRLRWLDSNPPARPTDFDLPPGGTTMRQRHSSTWRRLAWVLPGGVVAITGLLLAAPYVDGPLASNIEAPAMRITAGSLAIVGTVALIAGTALNWRDRSQERDFEAHGSAVHVGFAVAPMSTGVLAVGVVTF